jgi:hypothetical protein
VSNVVRRPLWRSFTQRFLANAAAHVRAGGHAMVWRPGPTKPVAWMLLPCGPEGEITELGLWSMLSLNKRNYEVIDSGPAKGLATMRIPRDYEAAVEAWCERDSKWPGATREIELDCVACSACCRANRVVLDDDDFARWRAAGRDDLRGRAYTRTSKGAVVLRLKADKTCVHLNGTLCGIYTLRPDNCSLFPAGSEPCLQSRLEEFGWQE